MYQRRPAGARVETRYGHDRVFHGPLNETDEFDVDEEVFDLRGSKYYYLLL